MVKNKYLNWYCKASPFICGIAVGLAFDWYQGATLALLATTHLLINLNDLINKE